MLSEAFEIEGRKFAVRNPGPAVDETRLLALEAAIGSPLPTQLRSYYLRWNGGLPYPLDADENDGLAVRVNWPEGAPAAQGGSIVLPESMLRVDAEVNDCLKKWKIFKDRFPKELLCFQLDPGGSLFLIGTGASNLGRVYFWARGYEADTEEGDVPGYDNIADVAPSFLEFLSAYRASGRLPDESKEDWIRRNYPTR